MKRRLIAKNKRWLQLSFKLRSTAAQSHAVAKSKLAFSSISEVKAYGQYCYQKRMNRQMRMNARQLKKHRNKQRKASHFGSRYGGMCKTELKPAGALQVLYK